MDRGKRELIKNNVAIHLIGWLVYLSLSPLVLANFIDLKVALYIAVFTALLHVTLFYTNAYVLVPKIFEKKRVVLYIFSVLLLAAFIIGIDAVVSINFLRPQFLGEMHSKIPQGMLKDGPFQKGRHLLEARIG